MKSISILATISCIALCGCGTHTSNLRQGNDVTYVSLGDQRAATEGVRVLTTGAPTGGISLGPVEAGRCHRKTTQSAPDEQTVILDLKIAAYARGADAISDVSVTRKSALTSNCWYVLDGRANAWQVHAEK